MHENNSASEPNPLLLWPNFPFSVSASALSPGSDRGGAMFPLRNNEFGCAVIWDNVNSSSGPYIGRPWFLVFPLAALLSIARKWASDGAVLSCFSASEWVLKQKQKQNEQLDLLFGFLLLRVSVFITLTPLSDLLDSSKMLDTPIRLPSVVLLSGKNDPVD